MSSKNNEGELMGVIIQKKDGGYLYTTTVSLSEHRYEHVLPIACCITSIPASTPDGMGDRP